MAADKELEVILEKLPPYIHIDDESTRAYLFISRDISGKWCASYFVDYDDSPAHHYHTVSENTLVDTAKALEGLL